jgi:hypothetical protein
MFKLDIYNFPIIKIPAIDGYAHFWPVTRNQFEFYLADHPSPAMDMAWYDRTLQDHPRVDVASANENNYARLFTTGVRPAEAQQIANWFGGDDGRPAAELPDLETWQRMFVFAKAMPATDLSPLRNMKELSPFARAILDRVVTGMARPAALSLADQMFLRHGVNEIVCDSPGGSSYKSIGYQSSQLPGVRPGTPEDPVPQRIVNAEIPNRTHGFRFIWRD